MMPLNDSKQRSVDASPETGERRTADRILVVVPAFNESGSLPRLIQELRAECRECDVVVIDDGSTDSTRETAAALTRVIGLPCNLGIGGAVQTGLLIAHREGYDFAVQVDGDGQHPPQELPRMLAAARENNVDLLVGSRFLNLGGFKSTVTRRMGIRFFGVMLSGICRTRITDPTSGFRVFNRRAIRLLAHQYPEDFPEVESLVVAHRAGLRIGEISVTMSERTAGRSSIGGIKSLIYMVKVSLAIFMNVLRKSEAHL
jgi:glycosyltransferase involved in cell wall biosynthesis